VATILHAKGDRSPSLTDTIKVDGVAFDLTGSSVKFQMRLETSQTLKVDSAAAIVSPTAGTVRYDWAAGDVDTEADYIGWWLVTLPSSKTQRTPEFTVQIMDFVGVKLDATALVGLRETKDWLTKNGVDTSDDLMITRLINSVSSAVYELTSREFRVIGTNPQTRTFDVDAVALECGYLNVGDLTSFTQVQTIHYDWTTVLETISLSSIQALPLVRRANEPIRALRVNWFLAGTPWKEYYQVKVTGNFGFPSVPDDVKQAVMDTVAYWKDRDVEHFRQSLSPTPGATDAGASVIFTTVRPEILSFPPEPYAILSEYFDTDLLVA
jgi:hypothetical protein